MIERSWKSGGGGCCCYVEVVVLCESNVAEFSLRRLTNSFLHFTKKC